MQTSNIIADQMRALDAKASRGEWRYFHLGRDEDLRYWLDALHMLCELRSQAQRRRAA